MVEEGALFLIGFADHHDDLREEGGGKDCLVVKILEFLYKELVLGVYKRQDRLVGADVQVDGKE